MVGTFVVDNSVPGSGNLTGIAFDGTNMWITSFSDGQLIELSPTGTILGTFDVSAGHAIAFDGTNMWVTTSMGTFVELSPAGAVLGTFPVGISPYALAFDGTYMWVVDDDDGGIVTVLSPSGSTVGTVSVAYAPSGIAFDGTNMCGSSAARSPSSRRAASPSAPSPSIPEETGRGEGMRVRRRAHVGDQLRCTRQQHHRAVARASCTAWIRCTGHPHHPRHLPVERHRERVHRARPRGAQLARIVPLLDLGHPLGPGACSSVFLPGLATFSSSTAPGFPACLGRTSTSGRPSPDSRLERTSYSGSSVARSPITNA